MSRGVRFGGGIPIPAPENQGGIRGTTPRAEVHLRRINCATDDRTLRAIGWDLFGFGPERSRGHALIESDQSLEPYVSRRVKTRGLPLAEAASLSAREFGRQLVLLDGEALVTEMRRVEHPSPGHDFHDVRARARTPWVFDELVELLRRSSTEPLYGFHLGEPSPDAAIAGPFRIWFVRSPPTAAAKRSTSAGTSVSRS